LVGFVDAKFVALNTNQLPSLYRNTGAFDNNAFPTYDLRCTLSWLMMSEVNTPRPTTSSDVL